MMSAGVTELQRRGAPQLPAGEICVNPLVDAREIRWTWGAYGFGVEYDQEICHFYVFKSTYVGIAARSPDGTGG